MIQTSNKNDLDNKIAFYIQSYNSIKMQRNQEIEATNMAKLLH